MLTVSYYRNGHESETELEPSAISEAIKVKGSLVWIDLADPTPEDFQLLAAEFGFHPLALADAAREHQRPKIDFYEGYFYHVFYAVKLQDEKKKLELPMISFFVGEQYLVTNHKGTHVAFERTRQIWDESIKSVDNPGVGLLLYSLLDAIVDDYFPAVDRLSDQVDALEAAIFADRDQTPVEQIFSLKKELIAFRRIVAPERDLLNSLIRWDAVQFDQQTTLYLQDVYDHLLRIIDNLDALRDLMSNNLDAHLSLTSNRLNRTMKTLTASSIVLMSMTLVASIYGMNFKHMPELNWGWGYAWALGLMVAIGLSLLIIFRRVRWI
jgi:magnesium transporter